MASSNRKRAIVIWILLAAAALTTVGVTAFWYLPPRQGAVAYLKIPRDQSSLFIKAANPSNEQYRQRKINYRMLLESPLVLESALQQQDIANLDVVRRHETPNEWLSDTLEISFPQDGEIMEVFLPCPLADADQCTELLNAVIQAYSDKVLLQERIEQAAAASDFRKSIADLEDELREELKTLIGLEKAAISTDEIAKRTLLKDDCRTKRKLLQRMKRTALRLQQEETRAINAERRGDSRPGAVSIIQKAVWAIDPPQGISRPRPDEYD